MNRILTLSASAVLTFVISLGVSLILDNQKAFAHSAAETKTETTKDTKKVEPHYDFVAQPGDSYTLLARKAVQIYNKDNKIGLNNPKIIAAETYLTINAGSPDLIIGQQVEIKKATVKEWILKASKLSKADEALWNVYVAGVNFDTSNVGKAS